MEVESCRNAASTLMTAKSAIDEQVAALANTVNNTVGSAWIAPSATEFQSAYQEWANTMRQMSEQLASLQQRLNAEIAEFEAAASRLS
jgi:WXG100 family type VII secretion target